MTFSKQPVAWIAALVVVLNVVSDLLTHSVDLGTAVNTVVTALGAVIAWNKVSPASKETDYSR